MLEKDAVYRKTASGIDALATRQGGLTPRQRSMLILVDGRRNGKELSTLGAACGDVAELMQALLSLGHVERLQPAPAPSPPAAPEAKPADPAPATAAGGPALTLPQARTQAVRRLTDLLGPSATELCLRLEAAKNMADFSAALRRTESALRLGGKHKAADFMQELHDRLGAG